MRGNHDPINNQSQPQLLKLSKIKLDEEIQPRQYLNQEVIVEYAKAMRWGGQFPPIVTYFDGTEYWLADGFHRIQAWKAVGRYEVLVEVRPGSRREAKLFAVGANLNFGFQRTNADKRRAVERLLQDSEWRYWSNREIARRCKVDPKTVNKLRKELLNRTNSMHLGEDRPQIQKFTKRIQAPDQRMVRRNGKSYAMNINKIGC